MLYLKPRILWVSQVAFLALMTIWVAWDPACELMIERLGRGFTTPVAAYRDAVAYVGWFRPAMLMAVIAGTLLSLSWLLREMLGRRQGNKQLRSLLAMLALTAIVAAWCGLAINHSALAWHAKRARLAWQVDQFESIAGPLRNDWPDQDGELPLIGPFMAYPFGKPSTLLLLKAPSVPGGDGSICAIERGESGSIKLQLGGLHGDDWVEWHPAASKPRSFTGGLGDSHDLGSSAALGAGWYLVRYNAPNRIGESRYTTRVSESERPRSFLQVNRPTVTPVGQGFKTRLVDHPLRVDQQGRIGGQSGLTQLLLLATEHGVSSLYSLHRLCYAPNGTLG